MKENIRRFMELQQNQGVVRAIRSIKPYIKNKYCDFIGGTQTLAINDVYAEFDTETDQGGDTIRQIYEWENHLLKELVNDLNDDDVFFDVGANLGIFSCFAAQAASQGYVVAFEPYPPNFDQLKRNLSYNANESDYDILNLALSDSTGNTKFTAPREDPGNQIANISPTGKSISIQAIRGDELVEDGSVSSPNVVKIDVEGAEPLVIDGLKNTLSNSSCRILYCEIHMSAEHRPSVEEYDESKESMLKKISELGFNIVYKKNRFDSIHIKAQK